MAVAVDARPTSFVGEQMAQRGGNRLRSGIEAVWRLRGPASRVDEVDAVEVGVGESYDSDVFADGGQFVRTRERGLYAVVAAPREHHLIAFPCRHDDAVETAGVHAHDLVRCQRGIKIERRCVEYVCWRSADRLYSFGT